MGCSPPHIALLSGLQGTGMTARQVTDVLHRLAMQFGLQERADAATAARAAAGSARRVHDAAAAAAAAAAAVLHLRPFSESVLQCS